MSVTPPWTDAPTCTQCKECVLTSTVDTQQDPDDDGSWLWCENCAELVGVDADTYDRCVKADGWWKRPDREQAWAEILRGREIDRVAAEHAARQLDMFGGGS